MPNADDLLNSRLSLAQACRALGIDPCLRPGESVTWLHIDPRTGSGINAGLYCHDPVRDDEPYVLSLGAYEEARIMGPNGEDYGTNRSVIASLDFALDVPDGEEPRPLDNPPSSRLRLATAELGAGWSDEDDRSLSAVLTEVGRILAGGPSERMARDETDLSAVR